MRKIAILNFKDGTGKTTTAVNLFHALALSGQINSRTFDNYFIPVRGNYGRNYQRN